jgi:hypothetical protein
LCFFLVFVFSVYVFKTTNQTLIYNTQTCFAVLETENLFPKQVAKRAIGCVPIGYTFDLFRNGEIGNEGALA